MIRLVLFALLSASAYGAIEAVPRLETGTFLERAMGPNEVHRYRVGNDEPALVTVVADRASVDLAVDGGTPVRFPIDVSFEWAYLPPGTAELVIAAPLIFPGASYRLSVQSYPLAAPADREPLVLAMRAAELDEHSSNQRQRAIELNGLALDAWPSDHLPEHRLMTVMRQADLFRQEAELDQALEFAGLAARSPAARRWLPWIEVFAGSVHFEQENWAAAETAFCRSLRASGTLSGCRLEDIRRGEFEEALWPSLATNFVGLMHHERGDLATASEWYDAALALAPDWATSQRARVVNNLGGVEFMRGNHRPALEAFQEALAIARRADDIHRAALALTNLAAVHMMTGNHDEAINRFLEALSYQQGEEDIVAATHTQHLIGMMYLELGHWQAAEDFLERSLRVREGRKLGDLAQSLLRLGNLRRAQGRTGEAGDLHEQAHRRFLDLGSLPGQFESLIEQAVDAAATGSQARVIELLSRAEALMPAIDDRRLIGRFHRLRALTLRRQGDLAGASETLGLALENFRASADPVGEIEALYQTALLREQQGRSRAAMDLLDHAIDNIEQSRLGVSNHALRASFTGERMDVFGKKVELLISAGDAERALEVAMNSRTRVLVESMLYKAAPGEDTERVHAQELKARLSAKSEARRRLQQMWPDSEEIRAIDQDIADVLVELDALEASLLSGRIGSTPEVTARQLRGLLTDEILIAHWVGETMSWRWEIRADHLAVTAMPPRRELHAEIERARSAIRASRRSKPHDSSRLASWLLGDIDLSAISHLYVIPDGATAIVPYNALTVPDDPGSLMIERTPITVVPGASLLGSRPRADSKKLAVLVSDPVFGADDPRVESTSAEAGFPRLAFSGHEASAVAESLRRRGYTVTDYRGFAANKEAVLSDELARASVVHFATHGLVDDDHPEASGLLLSSVTEAGEPRNGLLSLAEIYGLDLDAELIVLSACDTALGRDVIGEGPISLARGFLVGGSRQVVASLWQVSDVATKELMTRFYSAWADGRSAARALRDAQLELSRTRRFGGSHYWGAFVLVGAGETNDSLEAGSRRVSEPMNKAGGNHALQAHANRAPRVRTRLRMRRVSQGLAGGRGILRDYRTESHRPRR